MSEQDSAVDGIPVVLIITRSSWSTDNNTGNTLSNLFGGLDVAAHSLYLRADVPKNNIARSFFHITEAQLASSLIGGTAAGSVVHPQQLPTAEADRERAIYDWGKRWGGQALWLAREVLWLAGRWRSKNLDDYLDEIRPDVIFMPAFGCLYPYRILAYASDRCRSKVILFHTDDYYSLRQFRFSPLFWLNRMMMRSRIRRAAAKAAINYCISQEQVDEYSKAIGRKCTLLYKGGEFSGAMESEPADVSTGPSANSGLRLVFTGNISSGRWKTLVRIAQAIDQLGLDWTLEVYSHNTLTSKISREFGRCSALAWRGGVPSESLRQIYEAADVLVHVESLQARERMETRLAFSTKLVDYFAQRKCVLAVGWSQSASIAYLQRNDAALVACSSNEIRERLAQLASDPGLRHTYANLAWQCGVRNHEAGRIRQLLQDDMNRVAPHRQETA